MLATAAAPVLSARAAVRGARAQRIAARPATRAAPVRRQAVAELKAEDATKALAASMVSTLALAESASAAQEVTQLAADNRFGVLLALGIPVLGWVGFNIAAPAFRQLEKMQEKKRAVVAGITGLAIAALAAAPSADAAQEVAQVAADNRLGVLLALGVPVIGWVLFNIAAPASRQLEKMQEKKRAVVAGMTGLAAAALAAAPSADAAQEVAQLAADNRFGVLLALGVPVIGCPDPLLPATPGHTFDSPRVLFNIAAPASRQVENMVEKSSGAPARKK